MEKILNNLSYLEKFKVLYQTTFYLDMWLTYVAHIRKMWKKGKALKGLEKKDMEEALRERRHPPFNPDCPLQEDAEEGPVEGTLWEPGQDRSNKSPLWGRQDVCGPHCGVGGGRGGMRVASGSDVRGWKTLGSGTFCVGRRRESLGELGCCDLSAAWTGLKCV